jgi:hypothetical protein
MAFRQVPSPPKRWGVTMILILANIGNATLALCIRGHRNTDIAWRTTVVCRHTANRIPPSSEKASEYLLGKGAHQNSERFV